MREFDAFHGYPEPKEPRIVGPHLRTIENRIAASERGRDFYDGDRANGYGGMLNDGRWDAVAKNIMADYGLGYSRILQMNAHKGFLARALFNCGARVTSQEVSEYAAANSETRHTVCPFTALPYADGEFDMVIAASCVYSHNLQDAIKCLREIERVKAPNGQSWITLAAYEDEQDIEGLMLLRYWFLLGTTILTKSDWIKVMQHAGYTGDYRFDTAKSLNLIPGTDGSMWSNGPYRKGILYGLHERHKDPTVGL